MPPIVSNAYLTSNAVNEAVQPWQYTAEVIAPYTYVVRTGPAGAMPTVFSQQREFIVQLFPDNPFRALVYTQAPDSILERPVLSGEKRPEFAIDIDNINNPKSLSIELTIPAEFNTENILKTPFFKLELIENEAIPSNDATRSDWTVEAWDGARDAKRGVPGSKSNFRSTAPFPVEGTAIPAQAPSEAVGAARTTFGFTSLAVAQASTVIIGGYRPPIL